MGYIKPDAVVENMIEAGRAKDGLPMQALLRGVLSRELRGMATALAFSFAMRHGAV